MMTRNPMGEGPVYDERYRVGHTNVVKAVDKKFDVVGSRLAFLIDLCYRQAGHLSDVDRVRDGAGTQASALDCVVECVKKEFGFPALDPQGAVVKTPWDA